jgi:hypothetical protein
MDLVDTAGADQSARHRAQRSGLPHQQWRSVVPSTVAGETINGGSPSRRRRFGRGGSS